MVSRRARCSSCLPWLKLRRKTSTPAWNSASIISGVELAGPRVATILALRWRLMVSFCVGYDEYRAKIVDIGERRAGDHEIAQRVERATGVVVGKHAP